MRTHRITGVVVAGALVATLAGGALSTTAAAAAPADTKPAGTSATQAAPDATALLAQAKSLGDMAGVITPVTKLVQDVLAKPGTVPPATVTADAAAAKSAIDAAKAAAPAAPATPAAPALPAVPSLGTPGKAATVPAGPIATRDVKADALTALQTAVDSLVKAATAGDPAGLLTAATGVITGLVNVAVATVLSGGLPAPNLPGLPALPSLPSVPGAPSVPSLPAAPAL
ncbi:hypothetical protein ABZ901_29340 [Actinacidiphila alni]|uniref:hypothetical protein n=1 Tax=Actinacidiphila alni TaxID=380248 RepID=UPI0033E94D47